MFSATLVVISLTALAGGCGREFGVFPHTQLIGSRSSRF